MRVFFIVNPVAGISEFQKQINRAADHLSAQGCQVERKETKKPGDAMSLARQAAQEGFDVAVAVGGDGTVNEVCNGLANSSTALGVLPAGTANVYAADVGIPIWWPLRPDAVLRGAEILLRGQRRRIDLGQIKLADGHSRYFLMWCGIGLDAAISQARQPGPVRSLSYASWLVAGLLVTFDFMGTRATLETDTETLRERILLAVVSNGQLYGRIWRVAPQAKMDDGLLDVAVMSGHGWPSTIRHVVGLTLKQHIKDPDFHLYRTKHLSVSARDPLPVHVDAETIGTTPVEIGIIPRSLTIIVPQNAPPRLFQAGIT